MGLGARRQPKRDDDSAARSRYVGVDDPEAKAEVLEALAAELDRAPVSLTAGGEVGRPALPTSALRARADVAEEPVRAALTLVAQELEARRSSYVVIKPEGLRIRALWLRQGDNGGATPP